MKFKDLQAQYQQLKPQIDAAIQEVLDEGNFINGRQVRAFEEQLAEYVGVKHCISCANGTDAMSLVLMAWGIKEGDAVFVPDFTFFATAEVVALQGATPIFVDVRRDTFNIDVTKLEAAIEQTIKEGKLNPKAIIPVDLFGLPADHLEIATIAKKHSLLVLEDGAQGLGGSINDKMACSFGDAATTSFFPAKPVGCYGDGGAIFTDNDGLAEVIKSLKVHGKGTDKYDNIRVGLNSRLDTIQAAILNVKLQYFIEHEFNSLRKHASTYHDHLNDIIETPSIPTGFISSFAQYTIKLKSKGERAILQMQLKSHGIPSHIYYPTPMHQQSIFSNHDCCNATNINSLELCSIVLSLPIHPYLHQEDIITISQKIKTILSNRNI
ncbi:MAG: DegT/DnrJ/EryC1/StrS family aminotransferase [Kiritimatiellae bacterium]|nr:DegT/DnrJ/EryC1/StrS family aminotransferase [Kiritimatiellia bacterium]